MGRPLNTPNALPDLDMLNMLLTYEQSSGKLFWRERSLSTFVAIGARTAEYLCKAWNTKFANKEAGSFHGGYTRCTIGKVRYMAHRIIWKMVHGEEPLEIDHIDGDRANNRIVNLRSVTAQVNAKNRKLYENNTTEIPGVSFHGRDQVWQVRIGVDGRELHIGNFSDRDHALTARLAVQSLLDYHSNHGRN